MSIELDTITPIRVLVVDDSPFVCNLLATYLQAAADLEVIATAFSGESALVLVQKLKPDALTLDLGLPDMNGLIVLEQIMLKQPTPIIVISGVSKHAAFITLQALKLGAIDFVLKYTPGVNTNPDILRQDIISKVRAASQIRVIRSLRPQRSRLNSKPYQFGISVSSPSPHTLSDRAWLNRGYLVPRSQMAPYFLGHVVVIGASTGGPVAIGKLLNHLPVDFPAAVIIVQHIPANFTKVLAAQLNRQSPLRVKEAVHEDRLESGLVLVAPGDYHLLLQLNGRILLSQGPVIKGHRPSIDVTMQSTAQIYGPRSIGIVLSGMGYDGSLGLTAIRAKGGQTFAQDSASCVIDSMPQRAIEKGVVDKVGPPTEIAEFLTNIIDKRRHYVNLNQNN